MSGHSKWATTKHKKAALDAKRAKSFAKLIKNIEVAAKLGGADPSGNPALADAITKAKKTSVPNDNIDRAVKRGAGLTGEVIDYSEIMYEGYASGGVAIMIECLTDNKNRAAAEVRQAVTRSGGSMADPGSVAYNFSRKCMIVVKKEFISEDQLLEIGLDAGIEEVNSVDDVFEVICETSDMKSLREALLEAKVEYESVDLVYLPNLAIDADAELVLKVQKIVDAVEDLDDVQNVYTSMNISDEVLAQLEEQ